MVILVAQDCPDQATDRTPGDKYSYHYEETKSPPNADFGRVGWEVLSDPFVIYLGVFGTIIGDYIPMYTAGYREKPKYIEIAPDSYKGSLLVYWPRPRLFAPSEKYHLVCV